MFKRLIPLLALLLLISTGCVGKNTGTGELPPDDYSLTLPANWKFVRMSKVPARAKRSMLKDKMTLLGAYTGAPTNEFRLPFLLFANKDSGKASRSEILMVRDNIEQLFAMSGHDEGTTLKVNSKSYDEDAHRLTADATVTTDKGITLTAIVSFFFTEKGLLTAYGFAASGDTRSLNEIRTIMESVVLSPELQYQSDRHEIITAQFRASVVRN